MLELRVKLGIAPLCVSVSNDREVNANQIVDGEARIINDLLIKLGNSRET